MTLRELAAVFERIDEVSGRNAMIEILAELYRPGYARGSRSRSPT